MAKFNKRLTRQLKLAILRESRALIARYGGWTKGTWKRYSDNGRVQYCLVGAINEAAKKHGLTYHSGDEIGRSDAAVASAISIDTYAKTWGESHGYQAVEGAMSINDAGKTRKKDVLALVDDYIEKLEGLA